MFLGRARNGHDIVKSEYSLHSQFMTSEEVNPKPYCPNWSWLLRRHQRLKWSEAAHHPRTPASGIKPLISLWPENSVLVTHQELSLNTGGSLLHKVIWTLKKRKCKKLLCKTTNLVIIIILKVVTSSWLNTWLEGHTTVVWKYAEFVLLDSQVLNSKHLVLASKAIQVKMSRAFCLWQG